MPTSDAPLTILPTNELSLASLAGSPPGVPAFTVSKSSSSITATITNANGATSYQYTVDGVNWFAGLTASGLTASTSYPFQIRGINEFGTGSASNIANTVTAAPTAGQVTATGSGFGSGPTVVLFDRFDGVTDQAVVNLADANIGTWSGTEEATGATARYATYNGRGWFSGRDAAKIAESGDLRTALHWVTASPFTEFRLAHRLRVPDGFNNPGANSPNTHGSASNWKPVWLAQNAGGDFGGFAGNDSAADIVVPSHIGSGTFRIVGNSNSPRRLSPSSAFFYGTAWSFTSDNFFSFYQGNESSAEAADAPMDWLSVTGSGFHRSTGTGNPWEPGETGIATKSYSALRISAYYGNQPGDWTNVRPLHGDIYLAVGANARACIITGDAATLSACRQTYIIPPDTWTDTEVRYTPAAHEALPHVHIITADGTLIENVTNGAPA